jgi:hypothetical protein
MTTTTTGPARTNLRNVHLHVAARRAFNCNSTLTGGREYLGIGRLPERFREDFDDASDASDFYAVYSYATPIMWHARGWWYMPDVRYSVTTSRHQSAVVRSISNEHFARTHENAWAVYR